MEQNTTGAVGSRQGWREDGRVDIDAVRAGTHDVKECARRGCTAPVMPGSVYCTAVHERWDNPRVAVKAVS